MALEHETKTSFYVGLETADENLEIHPEEIMAFVKARVDAGTFYEGKALWKGELENCIVFECLDFSSHSDVTRTGLKEELEEKFKQDSVLTTHESVGAEF